MTDPWIEFARFEIGIETLSRCGAIERFDFATDTDHVTRRQTAKFTLAGQNQDWIVPKPAGEHGEGVWAENGVDGPFEIERFAVVNLGTGNDPAEKNGRIFVGASDFAARRQAGTDSVTGPGNKIVIDRANARNSQSNFPGALLLFERINSARKMRCGARDIHANIERSNSGILPKRTFYIRPQGAAVPIVSRGLIV
jgi:hypothetical protein